MKDRLYELVLVFKSTVAEEKRKKLLETVAEWLKDAKVTKTDSWGQKVLAYPIKRERLGVYYLLSIQTTGAIPADLDKRLQTQESILRHLIVRKK